MTDTQIAISKNGAIAQWGSRDDVREMVTRLRSMLPGGDKLNDGQIKALAQGAVSHGLDPLNGEIWMIPGRGLMIGVKGLRKKAHEQVRGNYWCEFVELTDPDARKRLRIPDGALAFECRLFDSENLRTYTETIKSLMEAHVPWEAAREMVGSKPYTPGIGVLKAGEQTKMEPAQCAMKRAEADALKRRFDVPFGLAVEADADAPQGGEWVEGTATIVSEPNREPITESERADKRAQDKASVETLFQSDAEQVEQAAVEVVSEIEHATEQVQAASVDRAKVRNLTNVGGWRSVLKSFVTAYPKYQTEVKGVPSGQPNMFHVLGAAAKCGYAEVNDGNFELVIEAIAKRAASE